MRFSPFLVALSAVLTVSCTQVQTTCITDVADLPLKKTDLPDMGSWENAPLRANAQYVLFGANSNRERRNRLGDYYFVDWYDAEPQKPVRLVMRYTQAATGTKELTRTVEYKEPRAEAASHKEKFFFSGPERACRGDVMTWRMELYCGGKMVDSRQSYLWE